MQVEDEMQTEEYRHLLQMMIPADKKKGCASFHSRRESITGESLTSFPEKCITRDSNSNPHGYKPRPENQNASYLGSPPSLESSRRNPHLGFNFRPSDINYQDVMKRLVSRYIHQTKKQLRQDGVNEDDLLEIKQDISSLR
ncbi:transient-receptor-potential-like protein [Trichonephila clavipes]|nr:transient-receptor-potential-like protein [Trichonephila clavipes]